MGWVGNVPQNSYTSFSKQDLTGASGGTLTLSTAVANENEIQLFINHVRQEPATSYTVSGTTVTLQGYTVAATDDIYVMYSGKALQTVVPPDGSVGTAKIADDAVTSAKLDTNIAVAGNLDVGTIRATNGTSAITIDSSGKVNTAQSGYEEKTAAQLNSGSGVVSNGISTLARRITLVTHELVTSHAQNVRLRVGNGGSVLSTSIYEYISWYSEHNANHQLTDNKGGTTQMGFDAWASTANNFNVHIEFLRIGNHWNVTGHNFDSHANYIIGLQGRIHNVGNIDTLTLFPAANTFTSGDAAVYWE